MEIELRRHLPPGHRVEVLLKANPDLSREQAEARLTSLWVACPAKGAEVSMGESCCQGCPHLKRIDYENYRIECEYEPTPIRGLEIVLERDTKVLLVICPLTEREVGVLARCGSCLYYRGEEEAPPHRTQQGEVVGWLHCCAPMPDPSDNGRGMLILDY